MKLKYSFETVEMDGQIMAVCLKDDGANIMLRLNETAAFILNLLKNETDTETVVDEILKSYTGNRTEITEYVKKFTDSLIEKGLVE